MNPIQDPTKPTVLPGDTVQQPEIERDSYGAYEISTVYDNHSGKITSTVTFFNKEGAFGEKLQIVSHTVMNTKEKTVRKALLNLGWTPPKEG
jgi:hypothetical protein